MKKRIISILMLSLFIACIIGIIYAGYNIIVWKKNVDRNKVIKKKISEAITIDENASNIEDKYNVDFEELKKQNGDTVAYLKVNNTNIDYVVVRGQDNSYYLNHNFYNEYNIAGWIFADFNNLLDGTDRNIVIYGHSTADGSMFGTLSKVLNRDWQENKDNLIVFITEEEKALYQVFSTYTIVPEDYYINTYFNNDEEFADFIDELKSRSNYDYNVSVNASDSILTLSSCNLTGSKRIVLHAKKIV